MGNMWEDQQAMVEDYFTTNGVKPTFFETDGKESYFTFKKI